MKTRLFLSVTLISFILVACTSQKQTGSTTQNTTIEQINEKVKTKNFKIDVNYAYPMSGKSIYLDSGYTLILRNDSALAYLPFFGVAYTAPYGTDDGGVKFREPIKNYSATRQKNDGEWSIKFNINTSNYNYDLYVDIYSNGKAMINVSSPQRQSIKFSGEISSE